MENMIAIFERIIIKSNAGAERFLDSFEGELYVETRTDDVIIEGKKKLTEGSYIPTRVMTRSKKFRGNILMPYCQLCDPVAYIYENRKYFNKVIRGE